MSRFSHQTHRVLFENRRSQTKVSSQKLGFRRKVFAQIRRCFHGGKRKNRRNRRELDRRIGNRNVRSRVRNLLDGMSVPFSVELSQRDCVGPHVLAKLSDLEQKSFRAETSGGCVRMSEPPEK